MANELSVYEILQKHRLNLTRAERQLANVLLDNWPVSGLGSITAIAQSAQVSTPTVARLVQKLGFSGFPQFQAALRDELEAKISNPIAKHERWSQDAPDGHILNRFADAVLHNLRHTFSQIDPGEFDRICALLADPDRTIFVAGGRITRTLAEYLHLHLQMNRSGSVLLSLSENSWPHQLLDMKHGDVVVVFDIRRYQNGLLKLAEIAVEKGAQLVLITDQWGSPVSRQAHHNLNCRIEAPSAWDSCAVLMVLVETVIAEIQSLGWETTSQRTRDLEDLFDRSGVFRKFK